MPQISGHKFYATHILRMLFNILNLIFLRKIIRIADLLLKNILWGKLVAPPRREDNVGSSVPLSGRKCVGEEEFNAILRRDSTGRHIQMPMGPKLVKKVNADAIKGAALAFVNGESVGETEGELEASELNASSRFGVLEEEWRNVDALTLVGTVDVLDFDQVGMEFGDSKNGAIAESLWNGDVAEEDDTTSLGECESMWWDGAIIL
jgi:hypothetical protein